MTGAGALVGVPTALAAPALQGHGTNTVWNGLRGLVNDLLGGNNGRVNASRNSREKAKGYGDKAQDQLEGIEEAQNNAVKTKKEGQKKQNKIKSINKSKQNLTKKLKEIDNLDDAEELFPKE